MTHVTDLYDLFMTKVSDYSLVSEDRMDSEVDEELFGYLNAACRTFQRKCRQELKIINDEVSGEQLFTSHLSFLEEDILVALMLVEYLKPQVLSSDTIRQNMSDKDFQVYSQANHLRELGLLYRQFRTEARTLLTEYAYEDIEDWKI